MERAYYSETVERFICDSATDQLPIVLGELADRNDFDLDVRQRDAWKAEIKLLRDTLSACDVCASGHLALEYVIPRLCGRIDALLFVGGIVYVIEFKVGEKRYPVDATRQVVSYCLDLSYFHDASKHIILAPIVICTGAPSASNEVGVYWENILKPAYCNTASSLVRVITEAYSAFANRPHIDPSAWLNSRYSPTPTIVEAARALYRNHTVKDLVKINDLNDTSNLQRTTEQILDVIRETKEIRGRSILFLTGVPGAGKTLVGLNVALQRMKFAEDDERAVFLSGNAPLVDILQRVLYDDAKLRQKTITEILMRKKDGGDEVRPLVASFFRRAIEKTFVQNIYGFRAEYFKRKRAEAAGGAYQSSICHIAIFDESQRAWTKRKVENKTGVAVSEPECLIEQMDLNRDWAVIICLVGGGQEIHDGEAGIVEWLRVVNERFPNWRVYLSDYMNQHPEAFDVRLFDEDGSRCPTIREEFVTLALKERLTILEGLHLRVSQRSFRSERISELADWIVRGRAEIAAQLLREINATESVYPIYLTRDLEIGKAKIKELAKSVAGSYLERYGIVASSYAHRLRADGLLISGADTNMATWMLGGEHEVNSSYFMEIAASEIKIQGLEVDYTIVAWEGDYRYDMGIAAFDCFAYRSNGWVHMNLETRQDYLRNAYRVILTRARQGMIIYVPKGNPEDTTRLPEFYDGTYQYLKSIGIPEL